MIYIYPYRCGKYAKKRPYMPVVESHGAYHLGAASPEPEVNVNNEVMAEVWHVQN